MSDNPFQSPAEFQREPVVGVCGGNRKDLRAVAVYQEGLLVSLLVQFALYDAFQGIANVATSSVPLVLLGSMIVVTTIGVVCVVLLVGKTCHIAIGILLIPFWFLLIPSKFFVCINLLVLLVVNRMATSVLRRNGYHVGLLGVALSEFARPPAE